MKASILIPAFNAENTLKATLQSCIAQGADVIEDIIVVDDHSTDGTQSAFHEIANQHPEFNWRLEASPGKEPVPPATMHLKSAQDNSSNG